MSIIPNERQLKRLATLEKDGHRSYLSEFYGERIVTALERYLTTARSSHITRALYDYLTMHAGFIAHFDLQQFRALYRDPADLLSARHEITRRIEPHPASGPVRVYRDGLTSREVWERLARVIDEHRDGVLKRSAERRRDAEIARARELAARHGLRLAPGADPARGSA